MSAVASIGKAVLAGLVDIWVKIVTFGSKNQNMDAESRFFRDPRIRDPRKI